MKSQNKSRNATITRRPVKNPPKPEPVPEEESEDDMKDMIEDEDVEFLHNAAASRSYSLLKRIRFNKYSIHICLKTSNLNSYLAGLERTALVRKRLVEVTTRVTMPSKWRKIMMKICAVLMLTKNLNESCFPSKLKMVLSVEQQLK